MDREEFDLVINTAKWMAKRLKESCSERDDCNGQSYLAIDRDAIQIILKELQ